jgi:hypothetical protein
MRTTLTLDDDVAARLQAAVKKLHRRFKVVVNEALRGGLDAMDHPGPAREPFRTTGFNLGPSLVGSVDNIEEVLARVEGEDHR